MWFPYKTTDLTVSEMFDLTVGDSEHVCVIEPRENADESEHGNQVHRHFTVRMQGKIRQKFRRLIRNDEGMDVGFQFTLDMVQKKEHVLVLSELGHRQWNEQMKQFIQDATYKVCNKISTIKKKNIVIRDILIHPLPTHPPWHIQMHSSDQGRRHLLKIENQNYPIKMELQLKIDGWLK
jgi:hypothetical protein